MKRLVIGSAVILLVLSATIARAQTVQLEWDRNTEPEVVGYVIEYGTASREYTHSVNVGNVTQSTVQLSAGGTYYFGVRAYTATGITSPLSNEVSRTVEACSYSLSSSSLDLPAVAAGGTFTVTTEDRCWWTVSKSDDWVAIGDFNGAGTRTVYFGYTPNLQPYPRTATITVGGQTLTLTQAADHTIGADFNGDGHGDIIWQNFHNGGLGVWRMNGFNAIAGVPLGPGWIHDTNWKVVGANDFDRDGYTDLLWQHDGGRLAIWYMRREALYGTEFFGEFTNPDSRWRIVATGDLDVDGYPDFLFQHANGTVAVWYMVRGSIKSTEVIGRPTDTNWKPVAAADFNRDGWLDLAWRNTSTGELAIWFLKNRELLSSEFVSLVLPDQDWQVVAVTDFNRDRRPDLVWRNRRTGQLAGWLMNGKTVIAGYALNPDAMDNNWVLAGPR